MAELDGKVALVTGAARRIGAAVAEALHGEGMRVVIHHHRSTTEAEGLADRLDSARPGAAHLLRADLLDEATPQALVDGTLERFGQLDLLVNNASTFYPTPIGEVNARAWDDLMGTNLKAPLLLSQAAAPALTRQRGSIVNLVDIHAMRPIAHYPVYCAAKAGLVMVTRSLAIDLAPHVRVNAIAPGAILWPEGEPAGAALDALLADVPLARMGEPREIARAVIFLARDATYTSGHVLTVDGARHG